MEPVSDQRLYSNRYQVTHLIAHGGMAMVYRAEDLLLGRAVALKILYPELSADPAFVERFRREAQAAARLSHPNIVPVFDWGEDEGTYFIVMELVEGTSLADVLRGGRALTAQRSAQLAAQIAAALGYAHRNGMVHRDVKPGNILITPDAQVKVADFGIAQAVASEDHLAEAGSVMGTATYFSPEQAEGAPVDGRSDVYSLGVVLYEMLVGRPPFTGETPLEVSTQHVHSAVTPPVQVNAGVPRDLDAIVMRALAKVPTQRYQTAEELREDLTRFTDGQPLRWAVPPGAFSGQDATQMVQAVTPVDRTQSIPVVPGGTGVTGVYDQAPLFTVKRRGRGGLWVVVLALLVIAAGGAFYALHRTTGPSSMPDVVKQTVQNAELALTHDGFKHVTTATTTSAQPVGTVIASTPKAGTAVSADTAIVLTVSSGLPDVTVPPVVGLSVSAATTAINNAGLHVTIASTTTLSGPPNTVLSQSPIASQKIRSGSLVTLYVLAAGSSYPVPNVQGQSPSLAGATLGGEQLAVSPTTTTQCSNTIAQGMVVGTSPSIGSAVTAGTKIELILSSGLCQVVVPNVLNDSLVNAQAALARQGLSASEQVAPASLCSGAQTGVVVNQSVTGGSYAQYHSTITIQYCTVSSPTGATGATGVTTTTTGVTGATGVTGVTGSTTSSSVAG